MRNIYLDVNNLDDFKFIGGNDLSLEFFVYDEDGVPVDISSATVNWRMSYYGDPDHAVIAKSGTINTTSSFLVELTSAETANLSGKFLHQPTVIDIDGTKFRPAQGIITIIPKIKD